MSADARQDVDRGDVLQERNWTEAELLGEGFAYFEPRRRIVLA